MASAGNTGGSVYNDGMANRVEVKLTGMAHGGEAMGRLGQRTVFVAYGLPGEVVRVQITDEHERWARGELDTVVTPSPQRIEPACPHFGPGRCGGCQWQHMTLAAQRDYKRQIVQDQLERLGNVRNAVVRPVVSAGPEWAYRTQAVFQPSGAGSLGQRRLHRPGIHPVDHCPILHPQLSALYDEFNVEWEGLYSVDFSGGQSEVQRLVTLRTRGNEAPELEVDVPVSIALEVGPDDVLPLIGEPNYLTSLRGHDYRWSAGTRRPVHLGATEALMGVAATYLAPEPGNSLLDIWCGNGLHLLDLASRVAGATGIESSATAMEDCAYNCGALNHIDLHEGTPGEVLPRLEGSFDLAVMTPPGEGLAAAVAVELAQMGVERLVIVAHNPAWLARDVRAVQTAGFRLREVTPVDVAPQTYLVSAVALFGRV